MTDSDANEMFSELCGEQLSAVTFVQDYLQLWFDGPGVNVASQITVQTATSQVTSWQAGFRDAMCAQIAKIVASVEFAENKALAIFFTDARLFQCRYVLSILRAGRQFMPMASRLAHGLPPNNSIQRTQTRYAGMRR